MIMVTHDIDVAIYLGKRIVVMSARPGEIKEIITVDSANAKVRGSADFSYYKQNVYIVNIYKGTIFHWNEKESSIINEEKIPVVKTTRDGVYRLAAKQYQESKNLFYLPPCFYAFSLAFC